MRPSRIMMFWPLMTWLYGCGAADPGPGADKVVTFRCMDNTWFITRPSNRDGEIVVARPMFIQVRLQEAPAPDGGWRYRGGGYTLSGQGMEAVWVKENRQPIRCTGHLS